MGRKKSTSKHLHKAAMDHLRKVILDHTSDGTCWLSVTAIAERLRCRPEDIRKAMAAMSIKETRDKVPYGCP